LTNIRAALEHWSNKDHFALHIECGSQCRSTIISKCIEIYPNSLCVADEWKCLPLHWLLGNRSSQVDTALMMIDMYPEAIEDQNNVGDLPLHLECKYHCISSTISKCIELYPKALEKAHDGGCLPLHYLLENSDSSANDTLMMIEKFPAAMQHCNFEGDLPIHLECKNQSRSPIISKSIELYSEALGVADEQGYLPLHRWLEYKLSTIEDSLAMLKEYSASLRHRNDDDELPIHLECKCQSRLSIISKLIELYPESLAVSDEQEYMPFIDYCGMIRHL
jgi:hypothetical protein